MVEARASVAGFLGCHGPSVRWAALSDGLSARLEPGAGDDLEFVLAHNVGALRDERRDHGALVRPSARDPARDPGRLLAQVLIAPLLSAVLDAHGGLDNWQSVRT